MYKQIISYNGKNIDFFFNNKNKNFANIFKGITYPIVRNLNPNIIFDIGANIGAASLFFAINYPESKIYSFEPTEINFSFLQKNVRNFSNIKIFQKGILNENKKLKIYINSQNPSTNSINQKWKKFDSYGYANFIKLQDYLNENNIQYIDILKIDTEGCEVKILQSIKSLIKKINVIYVEHHSEQDGLIIKDLLSTSHKINRYSLSSVVKASVNNDIVGMINYKEILHNENILIAEKQIISKEDLKELRKIKLSSIMIYSKGQGELCFVKKKLE